MIAGGLMLIWPCDLIVAADDAEFLDHTVAMGVGGAEFFAHPWELGVRKAKEFLFTADWIKAEEAHRLGMVNHVVPRAELESFGLAMAERIAQKPLFALKLTKQAVNAAQDAQGRLSAMQTSFALHHLAHAHNMIAHGRLVDPTGLMPADQEAREGGRLELRRERATLLMLFCADRLMNHERLQDGAVRKTMSAQPRRQRRNPCG